MTTVADLNRGEKGIIREFEGKILPVKLMEMGCLPGNLVALIEVAPLNDPIYINVSGSHIAIRRNLAKTIVLDLVKDTLP